MNPKNKKALRILFAKRLIYLVAVARSDLALGHNIALRKDKMVAGVHNHLNLLFFAIGLSERNITI
jgi:hypothetical protein